MTQPLACMLLHLQMGKMRVSTAGITAVICTKDVPFIIAADGDGSIHMLTSRGHLAPYQHVFSFSNLHIIPEIYDPEGELSGCMVAGLNPPRWCPNNSSPVPRLLRLQTTHGFRLRDWTLLLRWWGRLLLAWQRAPPSSVVLAARPSVSPIRLHHQSQQPVALVLRGVAHQRARPPQQQRQQRMATSSGLGARRYTDHAAASPLASPTLKRRA